MNSNSTTIERKTIKNTAYYIALRAITCLVFALFIIFVVSLVFLPQKASADTTSTYYIPVPGLGYYVDAQGRPIGTGSQVQYSCANTVCTPTTQSGSTNPGNGLNTVGNGSNQNAPLPTYKYPSYSTPVATYQDSYPSSGYNSGFSSYPVPSYGTPVANYANTNGTGSNSGDMYYSYPTYGSTPVYGKISAGTGYGQNYGQTGTGTTGASSVPNQNRGFQITSGSGMNNTGSTPGGFVMTSSGY